MRLTELNFILGEKKIIQFEVISTKKDERVVITEAKWSLSREGQRQQAGDCIVHENRIEVLLEPEQEGRHELTITYTIPPEVRKARCMLYVNPD